MDFTAARKRVGMTLAVAAKEIGVSVRTVLRWEKGSRSPVGTLIPAIQRVYRLTDQEVMSLFGKTEERS